MPDEGDPAEPVAVAPPVRQPDGFDRVVTAFYGALLAVEAFYVIDALSGGVLSRAIEPSWRAGRARAAELLGRLQFDRTFRRQLGWMHYQLNEILEHQEPAS